MSSMIPFMSRHRHYRLLTILGLITLLLLVLTVPWVLSLNHEIVTKFEGNRWELPARVYARPTDLFVGKAMTREDLQTLLDALHYARSSGTPAQAGEYVHHGSVFDFRTRSFHFPDEFQPSQRVRVTIGDGKITALRDPEKQEDLTLFRLEPVRIANIYPRHNEDRVLLKLKDVPPLLVQTLLTIEDRNFYHHFGVQPKSILRAGLANFRAHRAVQGGSTLTQQLVKNFFLSNERSLRRKLNEAVMALILEWHYDKDEILEAYLNEVYMGQDGARAIHGFGLAAQFYFQRDLSELPPEQLALLVGLVKGASYYAPRRHPERALARRNLVLDALVEAKVLDADTVAELKQKPLGVTRKAPSGVTPYPAFLQLVRRQLLRDYREQDLQSEGLIIFTTFEPLIQARVERAIATALKRVERDHGLRPDSLQAAFLLASVEQGEVLAAIGGRDPRYAGFNRALDMHRPVGSVIKPAVYLTALMDKTRYTLLTLLDDSELTVDLPSGEWSPHNYDNSYEGPVTLLNALVHSRNVPTVRLGMDIGVGKVVDTLHALGVSKPLKPYPSLLLGAAELSPLDVLQMYQTLAAGGYRTPLRSILAVIDQLGDTLQRYPLEVEQAVPADADFLLTSILHEVTVRGTGQALQYLLPPELGVAGKTGTTDDLRDSWFAGFSGEHVGVAWVGRDDNQPTGLTGASGALRLWAEAFARLTTRPLKPLQPDNIEWALGDPDLGVLVDGDCGVWIPFIAGSPKPEMQSCDAWQQQTPSTQQPPPAVPDWSVE